jgi:hypothetical protein
LLRVLKHIDKSPVAASYLGDGFLPGSFFVPPFNERLPEYSATDSETDETTVIEWLYVEGLITSEIHNVLSLSWR